jgi:hypothetical protein
MLSPSSGKLTHSRQPTVTSSLLLLFMFVSLQGLTCQFAADFQHPSTYYSTCRVHGLVGRRKAGDDAASRRVCRTEKQQHKET